MSKWLDFSANMLKQTYIKGFLDISGKGIYLRNDSSLNFYDIGNSTIPMFSIKSDSMRLYDPVNEVFIDVSNSKLKFIQSLTQDVQNSLTNLENITQNISINNANALYLEGGMEIQNDLILNGRLFVNTQLPNIYNEDLSVNMNVFVGKDISLNGNFYAAGDVSMNSRLYVGSDVSFNGNLYVSQNITSGGNLKSTGVLSAPGISIGVSPSHNVIYGLSAGLSVTGSNNVLLGYQAATALTSGSNNTVIGYQAATSTMTVSNEITLGNSSIQTLRCNAASITSLSDLRDKTNIEPIPAGLDFISKLTPVKFTWNMRDGGKTGMDEYGFIAQDLQFVQNITGIKYPNLVYENDPEKLEASYSVLIPSMVKAIQELKDIIMSQQSEIELLKNGF